MTRRLAIVLWMLALCVGAGPACDDSRTRQTLPDLTVSTDVIDFGTRPLLEPVVAEVRLTSVGRAPVEITNVTFDDDQQGFSLPDGPVPSVLAGASETVLKIRFLPREERPYVGQLVLETNDPDSPRTIVALTGVGNTAAAMVVEPTSIDFGRVGEGRSTVRRVRLTSTGSAGLQIRTIALAPGAPAGFGFVGSVRTPQEVRAHAEGQADAFAEINLQFAPTVLTTVDEGGQSSATLVLETNDPQQQRLEIPLTARINRQPVADAGDDRPVALGAPVVLDGSASTDPDGDDPLTYRWTLIQRPPDSAAELIDPTSPAAAFQPDLAGAYVVELVVTDAAGLSSAPARVSIAAQTTDRVVVELVWSHPVADLDLHVRPDGRDLDSDADASGYNQRPDWGISGDLTDNPWHTGDRLAGFGPERLVYVQPAAGTYRISAGYVSAQGSADTQVQAMVRVFLYGVVVQETSLTFTRPGQVFDTALLRWPSATVEPLSGATP